MNSEKLTPLQQAQILTPDRVDPRIQLAQVPAHAPTWERDYWESWVEAMDSGDYRLVEDTPFSQFGLLAAKRIK